MRPAFVFFASILMLAASSCISENEPGLPQAFVAPATINLRSELNQKNSTVTTLKHGDEVSVVDVRRRYVKVRTKGGAEGWVDSADLLRPQDMARIRHEHQEALNLPTEAIATAYENLNVHLDPSRASPAFAQIPEGAAVNVLARKLAPKVRASERPVIIFERPKPPTRHRRKEKRKPSNRPPMPRPPKPPANLTSLWGNPANIESEGITASNKSNQTAAPPPVMEAWNLVRMKDNQTGWVLSRNLMMAIPDEVAQYAEGKHITSFFQLGTVNDEARGTKHDWLWTTSSGIENSDFDSWRVFLWNRRRHRYETSYRQRDVEGYFPVHADPPNFELIFKDDDGKFRRRTYFFDGTRVHLKATELYDPNAAERTAAENAAKAASARKQNQSWWHKKWQSLEQRFAGRH